MLWRLGGLWRAVGAMLWLVPWPIRHFGYKMVAANRYRIWGKRETCRLRMVEERDRFLA
jgi:predicted DCC family thiol-disulfide oxidoreductase YuxK